MSQIPIIGLTGRARVGKDTVARFIVAARGGYQYSFADPMRAMLRAGFGIDMNDPFWEANKETVVPALGKSPREIMQTLGTEWGRNMIGSNTWITMAQQRLLAAGPGMVISDVRFENEAHWVRKLGGRIMHIKRDDAQKVAPHSSEGGIAMAPGDGVILNNGSLQDLQQAVKDLFHLP